MYLTQEEAKKKICPHMTYGKYTAANPGGHENYSRENCFVDNCMAWRWAGNLPSTEKGYCGLSGRPGSPLTGKEDDAET